MKKSIYVVIAFLSLGLMQMNAQVIQGTTSSSSSDIRFGAKAGLNMATLGGSTRLGTSYSYSMKPGFHLGGVLEIPFNDIITIQPEALVSLQGSGGYAINENVNLWYLTVPVMGKYNVWDDLYIEAGPYLGVMFGDNIEEQNISGLETNTLDLGIGLGAGYQLDDNFYFQLRFNAGFINAIEDENSKNRVIQVSAVYFL
ncbi:outer membrane protein with beta-barrel domain [Maribacter vaceletii]|uniref:Outer membrane protein with beta-barrel domain n=1 Tax=Maribacter vaceletii TaxID=1206816 RepID=A0A495DS01_9FLAO|nr:porin family protein [Maribacter vaceletii]RKR06463.1 outer membrane protein with beta-barrel domain [Maribacter vaceletii]